MWTTLLLILGTIPYASSYIVQNEEEYHHLIKITNEQAANDSLSSSPSPRIVGGKEAIPGSYRFTAGLRYLKNGPNFCGGALIDRTHVLTAAHCIQNMRGLWGQSLPAWVSLGSHFNDGSLYGQDDGVTIRIKKITLHPKYNNPIKTAHDFALLTLLHPAPSHLPILPLAPDVIQNTTKITVVGWGLLVESGQMMSNALQEVPLSTLSRRACHDVLGSSIHPNSMLCAQGLPGTDSCQGDSGGPVFTTDYAKNGTLALVGLVSWGIGCARVGLPGVYARVSSALGFINAIRKLDRGGERGLGKGWHGFIKGSLKGQVRRIPPFLKMMVHDEPTPYGG